VVANHTHVAPLTFDPGQGRPFATTGHCQALIRGFIDFGYALSCLIFGKARKQLIMRRTALVVSLLVGLSVPAFAQKADIEAVNSKWIEFFNKNDFAGVASLYAEDATAFPPGSGMVKGRAAIGEMWKSVAEKVSDPKLNTLDVKLLGPSAAREIGTFSLKTKGPIPQEVTGKYVVVWEKIGNRGIQVCWQL
jgi:uncharacterized protein (TIGR02246 family)